MSKTENRLRSGCGCLLMGLGTAMAVAGILFAVLSYTADRDAGEQNRQEWADYEAKQPIIDSLRQAGVADSIIWERYPQPHIRQGGLGAFLGGLVGGGIVVVAVLPIFIGWWLRRKSTLLLAAMLLTTTAAVAGPRLHDLDIRVALHGDGSASIVETRRMTIDSEGTECYIGLANMGGSTVRGLWVTDETGKYYENVGEWDTSLRRSQKAGKCGIVKTSSGYELCWGLGSMGERTYTTGYVMTGLVRSYPDADAIRHVFLDRAVTPKPAHARITIVRERLRVLAKASEQVRAGDGTAGMDTVPISHADSCGIWSFGFEGTIDFLNGAIVAETDGPMGADDAIYLMCSFPKGMFQPTLSEDDTFEHKKELALEGSDYGEPERRLFDRVMDVVGWVFLILLYGGLGVAFVGSALKNYLRVRRFRRKVNDGLTWYRDIPLDGDLREANEMYIAVRDVMVIDGKFGGLLPAAVLQLVNLGALAIRPQRDAEGNVERRITVNAEADLSNQIRLLRVLHDIFRQAAGDDGVLDPGELQHYLWADKNQGEVGTLIGLIRINHKYSDYEGCIDQVQKLLGLRMFLIDFTLMNERHAVEVGLWKDYMVWATLFGNAEQVVRDMRQINPDYFLVYQEADLMTDNTVLPAISSAVSHGITHYHATHDTSGSGSSKRSSGGGGRSSRGGGGGGFSGRGGGGGVR